MMDRMIFGGGPGERDLAPASAARGFRFGIEAEFLLVEAGTYRPLDDRELDFDDIEAALEAIPTDDLPGCDGLDPKPPHRKAMPFYVEGYHVPDPEAPHPALIPKGVEVRTPPLATPEAASGMLVELVGRLREGLATRALVPVAASYHPSAGAFHGPRGDRSPQRWRWAQRAMRTYGPDVNVTLPARRVDRIDPDDLEAKVNAYAPALVLPTLASPLHRGAPWVVEGHVGASIRTALRSPFAPSWKRHAGQGGRFEFKGFEMSPRLEDLHAGLLLWLALLLDDGLRARDTDEGRIVALGAIARDGLAVAEVRDRASEVVGRAPATLERWEFDPGPIAAIADRLEAGRLPADEILGWYRLEGSIPAVLRHLDELGRPGPLPLLTQGAAR